MVMNKRYITSYVFEKVSNQENGTTKVNVQWTIDFSRLPNMRFLLDFLSNILTNEDFNNIDQSLQYWDHRYYTFSFVTTASSKVSKKDTYSEDIG